MTDEKKVERLEKRLKEVTSWWRAAEKQFSQKNKETKANQKTIEQLKAENAALRERLEKAVELPFKIGEKVWHFEYDEFDEKYDIVCRIFVGGNNEYAFLSPAIYTGGQDLKDAYSICDYYYNEYKENDDECSCIVIPYEECFATREAAEARLAELKGEQHG